MKNCRECQIQNPLYNEQWDAFFCGNCYRWLEDPCGCRKGEDDECYFQCWNRPEKASKKNEDE